MAKAKKTTKKKPLKLSADIWIISTPSGEQKN
jgi:hypothetical protein